MHRVGITENKFKYKTYIKYTSIRICTRVFVCVKDKLKTLCKHNFKNNF